ncbi:DnaJ domain-containing protein [Pelotomaculum terephthalicicum JT]|uniref:DnaJ C-terminal domain-containing protein n=1 Tax=Pelotomaculum TaxID=191373 RepID=UPI0009C6FB8E|nr:MULTISPECIES: DnaJ C-terminal domain-containing protein [Pelotomaculum]MCG9968019.1 DnaJ domain-containing protein [Pelotomaculum terephthalicicum JT]OPX87514.1 MAG: Curved DNA-binding protein [Pelotomaculum sp. PtaB.Bin117]OPY60626.1 MAG: Curved DNA-binding protein [Pelotomaculum sp. PtaU1.Bin065]
MHYKDYYSILGVEKTAGVKEIKKAYRELARRFHPDANPGDKKAEERFKEISEAYEVLSDPEKRKKYDEIGADIGADWQNFDWSNYQKGRGQWREAGPGGVRFHYESPGYGGFSDFFRTFFGDMDPFTDTDLFWERRGRGRGGADTEARLELSLEEAFAGANKEFLVNGRHLKVKVPPGMREGYKLRVPQQGESMQKGGPAGDLYLSVSLRPHPLFKIKDKDLEYEVPVAVTEAVLGGEVNIPTLKGTVSLKIPPRTQTGKVFRLRGMGMPDPGGGGPGNLLVKVKVVIPETVTRREEELYKTLAELNKENPRARLFNMLKKPGRRV